MSPISLTEPLGMARTECALFYLQSRVAACVLTKENRDQRWLIDNEAQLTLARMGQVIAGGWPNK